MNLDCTVNRMGADRTIINVGKLENAKKTTMLCEATCQPVVDWRLYFVWLKRIRVQLNRIQLVLAIISNIDSNNSFGGRLSSDCVFVLFILPRKGACVAKIMRFFPSSFSLYAGTKPERVINFKCRSYNWENLTCSFERPYNPVPVNYTLYYATGFGDEVFKMPVSEKCQQ